MLRRASLNALWRRRKLERPCGSEKRTRVCSGALKAPPVGNQFECTVASRTFKASHFERTVAHKTLVGSHFERTVASKAAISSAQWSRRHPWAAISSAQWLRRSKQQCFRRRTGVFEATVATKTLKVPGRPLARRPAEPPEQSLYIYIYIYMPYGGSSR